MSIESGGYFGSNSAEEQPRSIPRYHLDRCEPVMDRDDEDGEYCRWDDVQPFVEHEPCEGCNLPPVACRGLTVKQACIELSQLRASLHIIAHMGISGLGYQADYEKCVNIAKEALEI